MDEPKWTPPATGAQTLMDSDRTTVHGYRWTHIIDANGIGAIVSHAFPPGYYDITPEGTQGEWRDWESNARVLIHHILVAGREKWQQEFVATLEDYGDAHSLDSARATMPKVRLRPTGSLENKRIYIKLTGVSVDDFCELTGYNKERIGEVDLRPELPGNTIPPR